MCNGRCKQMACYVFRFVHVALQGQQTLLSWFFHCKLIWDKRCLVCCLVSIGIQETSIDILKSWDFSVSLRAFQPGVIHLWLWKWFFWYWTTLGLSKRGVSWHLLFPRHSAQEEMWKKHLQRHCIEDWVKLRVLRTCCHVRVCHSHNMSHGSSARPPAKTPN